MKTGVQALLLRAAPRFGTAGQGFRKLFRLSDGGLNRAVREGDTAAEAPIEPGTGARGRLVLTRAARASSAPAFIDEAQRLPSEVARRLAGFLRSKDAALKLRRTQRFAGQVMETIDALLIGLDARGQLVFINAAGEAPAGYSRPERARRRRAPALPARKRAWGDTLARPLPPSSDRHPGLL
jgi:PAS domain-containing protein